MKKKPSDMDLNSLEKLALDSIQRIFPCEENLLDRIPLSDMITTFSQELKSTDSPFFIRLAGQSGSGKSSQLLPAVKSAYQGKPYTQINVGKFAQFHPQYEFYQHNTPDEMREKTNGFALRSLFFFTRYCLLNRINIIMDMTLLEPEIDLYLTALAQKNNYRMQTHILCVPKKVSDHFIRLRQNRTGRKVRTTSSHYFFNALPVSLKGLTSSGIFNKADQLFLWSHYHTHPVYQTNMNNPWAVRVLEHYRSRNNLKIKDPKKLLKAKTKWFNQTGVKL